MMVIYYLNYLHSFRTKIKKHKCNKEVESENKDFCGVVTSFEATEILSLINTENPIRHDFIICADLETLVKIAHGFKNNPEKSSIAKIGEHMPCGYSMSTTWNLII